MNKTAEEWYDWIEQQCHDRQKQHDEIGSHPFTNIRRRVTIMALEQALKQNDPSPPSPTEKVPDNVCSCISPKGHTYGCICGCFMGHTCANGENPKWMDTATEKVGDGGTPSWIEIALNIKRDH